MRRRPGAARVACWLAALLLLAPACNRRALLPRGEGAAVVVVDAAARSSSALPDEAEREPNDKPGAAQNVVLGPAGVVLAGTLAVPLPGARTGDSDVFRIHLDGVRPDAGDGVISDPAASAASAPGGDAGAPLAPSASPPERTVGFFLELVGVSDPAVRLEVLDGNAAVIQATSGRSGRLGIPNLAAPAGDDSFLVRVSRGRAKAQAGVKNRARGEVDAGVGESALLYRLAIVPTVFSLGDEIEPNGDAARATPLAVDASRGEAAGLCGFRGDEDWFVVDAVLIPPGGGLAVELDLPPGVAARLRVTDAAGRVWIDSGVARGRIRPPQARGPQARGDAGSADVAVSPTPDDMSRPARLWITVKTEGGFALDERYVLRVQGVIADAVP